MSCIIRLVIVVIIAGLNSSCALFNSNENALLRKCYDVEVGPWSTKDGKVINEKTRIVFYLENPNQVHLLSKTYPSHVPYIDVIGGWSLKGDDVEVFWSTGLVGTVLLFRANNSSVEGNAEVWSDNGFIVFSKISGSVKQCTK